MHGYAKPLTIDRGSWDVLDDLRPTGTAADAGWFDEQWQVVPDAIADTATARLLVFPRYEPDATTRLQPLSPPDALERALTCTFVATGSRITTDVVRRLAAVARPPLTAVSILHNQCGYTS